MAIMKFSSFWLWLWLTAVLHNDSFFPVMAAEDPFSSPTPAPSFSLHTHHHTQHRHHSHHGGAAMAMAPASVPSLSASPADAIARAPAALPPHFAGAIDGAPSLSPSVATGSPAALGAIAKAPASVSSISRYPAPSPSPSSKPLPATSPSPPAPLVDRSKGVPLDPEQLAALRTLGIHVSTEPCTSPSMHETLVCDKGSPARHVIALHLELCARDVELDEEAMEKLETLQALSFLDCPMLPARMPAQLLRSLTSLTCIASLGTTASSPDAPALPSTWLSAFRNLSELAVADVHVNASGLPYLISKMKHLKHLKFSNINLTGFLPLNTWPANLTSLDLAFNAIAGPISPTLSKLTLLTELDLSHNHLSGHIPEIFSKLKKLQKLSLASNSLSGPFPVSLSNLSSSLIYLDLSNNKLKGPILDFLNSMKSLRYLDLSHNHFSGPLPFNQTFLDKLNTLKVRGNLGLCYDHSMLSSPFLEGVPTCDSSGMPIVPSTLSPAQPLGEAFAPSQLEMVGGSPSQHGRGPRIIIAAVAITLVVIIVFIIVVVLVSKCRGRKY